MARRARRRTGWRLLDDEGGLGHRPQPPRPTPGPAPDPRPVPGPTPDPNQVPVPNPAPQPNPTEGPQFGDVLAQ
ncbi:MAG TPA: hypothetical protein VMT87_02085 [Vicinamibacteria bacterium]|nr:hypothetical protein [Vicinamibacteria bacterium]